MAYPSRCVSVPSSFVFMKILALHHISCFFFFLSICWIFSFSLILFSFIEYVFLTPGDLITANSMSKTLYEITVLFYLHGEAYYKDL